jgi:hypothetical protein
MRDGRWVRTLFINKKTFEFHSTNIIK